MRLAFLAAVVLLWAEVGMAGQVKSDIEYARVGDTSLKLDAHIPSGDGPFPVVIVVHGGGWGGGDKSGGLGPIFKPLADDFVCFSIDYRLAPANRWPAPFDDVNAALRWVKAHAGEYKGDPARVALLGYSAGGQLAVLAAEQAGPGDAVQAVVGLAPPTDFEQDLPQRGGLSKALQDLLDRPHEIDDTSLSLIRAIGPIHYVHPGLPPFLLIQGEADKTVPVAQTRAFADKLRANHVPCELVLIPHADHRLRNWTNNDPHWQTKLADWLRKTLATPATPATRPSESAGE